MMLPQVVAGDPHVGTKGAWAHATTAEPFTWAPGDTVEVRGTYRAA